MALFITNKCISCGICELQCPNEAISIKDVIYEIDYNNCNECVGFYKRPNCQEVCPISNAIIRNPK